MPLLARSIQRKAIATVVVSLGFVFVYETTIRDSRYAARQAMLRDTTGVPMPGARLQFAATAYCKGSTTASGVGVRTGIAASDSTLLPVGSVISINTGDSQYNGIYTIMDTGPAVQGRILDLYMWSCREALAFGRREVQITVLRLGWNPRASTPGVIDTIFRRREAARSPRPDRERVTPSADPPADAPPPTEEVPPISSVESSLGERSTTGPVELPVQP
ncbi:MAG TPA: 3D domain-containing protein [Vicinamibacterales bacterium]|jgi:3D (Asp-Asp-Asp) domain-containing protein|nr:3D domain-containing protein [Vicinamibacterales bacterium]